VVGNLKSDALPMPASSRESARQTLGLDPERPLLVLASIRPGESGLAARAWGQLAPATRERWQVAALPRHPRASAELRAEAMRSGASLADGGAPRGGAWRWDDRLGVLADYYAAADVALIGGSLVPLGGHNPLEAAACGAAVIIGPYHESQAEGVERLRAHRAVRVAGSAAELCAVWEELLGSPGARAEMSAGGLATVAELRGAGARTVARLAEWKLWPPA
jgi:3-deoxy-D-manno-octulosonic-acid transferase